MLFFGYIHDENYVAFLFNRNSATLVRGCPGVPTVKPPIQFELHTRWIKKQDVDSINAWKTECVKAYISNSPLSHCYSAEEWTMVRAKILDQIKVHQ